MRDKKIPPKSHYRDALEKERKHRMRKITLMTTGACITMTLTMLMIMNQAAKNQAPSKNAQERITENFNSYALVVALAFLCLLSTLAGAYVITKTTTCLKATCGLFKRREQDPEEEGYSKLPAAEQKI